MLQAVNLHAIVLDVVDEMGPFLDDRRITVRGAMTHAFVDRAATSRILMCLLTNAASFSARDARIEVKIGPGTAVHVAVRAA